MQRYFQAKILDDRGDLWVPRDRIGTWEKGGGVGAELWLFVHLGIVKLAF